MPWEATATSEQVVAAYAAQVKDRTFVITGAGQPSIGSSMATELAKASPAHILIASRTAAKVDPVLSAIRSIDPSIKATFVQLDLLNHTSVRKAASDILAATGSNIDGIEIQMSANHVGHFLLTNLLVPALLAGSRAPSGARIVNITSGAYQISPVRFNDPAFSGGKAYDPWTAYSQQGVVLFACHPGSNMDTNLGSHLSIDDYSDMVSMTKRNTGNEFFFNVGDKPRFKTYEQIGATPLITALDPELSAKAPAYLQNNQIIQPAAGHAYESEHVEKCWKLSEGLVSQEFQY
ncbi:MAG: hypothetical protein LQ345_001359 [Seirophora villosa]|nr:MAG: hypothetical protein LQ345_001359 [Seirophora villosa]